jgi:hypothetical protein
MHRLYVVQLESDWKSKGKNESWPILRYYRSINSEELRKIIKTINGLRARNLTRSH